MCKAYDDGYDAGYAKALARIKELEEALLSVVTQYEQVRVAEGYPSADSISTRHARAILNKK